jgi:predicted RNA binding protein YcfA (HicA-like mRNA interferase family)
MRAPQLLAILQREPLAYRVVRRAGSHRRLESPNGYRPITFAYHDRRTLGPREVRAILVGQVGLPEADALALVTKRIGRRRDR